MFCDQQSPVDVSSVLSSLLEVMRPALADLVTESITGPRLRLCKLRDEVEGWISCRLSKLYDLNTSKVEGWTVEALNYSAEVARLRTLQALLPLLGIDALLSALGSVQVDGRPDYMRLKTCCANARCSTNLGANISEPPTVADRVAQEVAWATTTVQSFPHEVSTVWVGRPAVEAAVEAIQATGREVEVRRQPDHAEVADAPPDAAGEWVRDLLIVQPPKA